jgi:ribosomal protein S18 acetylase RimI-like enzyme
MAITQERKWGGLGFVGNKDQQSGEIDSRLVNDVVGLVRRIYATKTGPEDLSQLIQGTSLREDCQRSNKITKLLNGAKYVVVARNKQTDQVIGFGVGCPVVTDPARLEMGLIVDPQYRQQGIGKEILAKLYLSGSKNDQIREFVGYVNANNEKMVDLVNNNYQMMTGEQPVWNGDMVILPCIDAKLLGNTKNNGRESGTSYRVYERG